MTRFSSCLMVACAVLALNVHPTRASGDDSQPPEAPALFPGLTPAPPGSLLLIAQDPAVDFCFDPLTPPTPEVQAQIERLMGQSLLRYYQRTNWAGGGNGTPIVLTWSFVPEGLNITGGTEPASGSNLFANMDRQFGNRAQWIALFQSVFDRWESLTGVVYVRVRAGANEWDDGAAWGASGAAGLRGDLRIAMHRVDGPGGILAYNYYPPPAGGVNSGDMVLDSSENWANPANGYRFLFNVLTHEHGHGLGLAHVCPPNGTKLLEPFYTSALSGPQHDDTRGAINYYGDPYEPNNNIVASKTLVPALGANSVISPSTALNNLLGVPNTGPPPANGSLTCLSVAADEDWFFCNLSVATTVNVSASPIGLIYDDSSQAAGGACNSGNNRDTRSVYTLSVDVRNNPNGAPQATATAAAAGQPAVASVALPAGVFWVRVYTNTPQPPPPPAPSPASQSQLYNLVIATASAAPANDNCAAPTPLVFDSQGRAQVSGSTLRATATPGGIAAACGSSANAPDVWYSFTPTCSQPLTLSTCGSALDTVLSVYTGACNALSQVACNDDAAAAAPCEGSRNSYLTVDLTAFNTYLIRVSGFNGATGAYTLTATLANARNDLAVNATVITPGVTDGTLCGATNDGRSSCGQSSTSPDVWYSYTPTADGVISLGTCGANFDTVVSVHCVGNPAQPFGSEFNQIACNDDATAGPCAGTHQSYLTTPVSRNTPYLIRVSGFNGQTGSFPLGLAFAAAPPAPANNACAAAIVVGPGTTAGTTLGATNDGSASCAAAPDTLPDVWYSYTPTCTNDVVIDTCGSCMDTLVSVYTGACGARVEVACNDDAPGGFCGFNPLNSGLLFPATRNTRYLIRVAGVGAQQGNFNLNITPTRTPANDTCAQAAEARPGPNPFDTTCATSDGAASCGISNASPDVWFDYTSICNGRLSMDVCGATFDTVLSVYTGACGALTEVACNDDAGSGPCAGTLRSFVCFPARSGTAYKIRVSGHAGAAGSGNLTIRCCPADMNCDGAVNVADYLAFLNFYAAANPLADINADSRINVADYLAFLTLYSQGCF
jgi:hypothetical protein